METNKTKQNNEIFSIDPRNIVIPDGFNSRVNFGDINELAEQIKECGMLNPVTVQAKQTEDGEKYTLIDGERRYRAIMQLIEEGEKINYIKAIIIPSSLTMKELYQQQAMRNEGKNFNEYEWAILARKIQSDCGIDNASEIAKMLGKNPGVVLYWLQILDMPEDFQDLVRTNQLGGSDLRRILQANGRDFDKARKDIELLREKAEETGEKKLSLKSLDFNSQTKVFKDSKALLKGLNVLIDYAQHFQKEHPDVDMDVNLMDLHEHLKNGGLLNSFFEKAVEAKRTA